MPKADLTMLGAEDFEAASGEPFRVIHPGGTIDARLHAVTPAPGGMREKGGFTLTFATAPGPFLPQAIHRLDHPRMGALEIFLVPIGPRDGVNLYAAVFY